MEKKITILLVEDDNVTLLSEARQLEKCGYQVVLASNCMQAMDVMEGDEKISLVLMDILLGDECDGIEAARKILHEYDIPLIFLTGHSDPDIISRAQTVKPYGYVLKQSGLPVLDAAIGIALNHHEEKLRIEFEKAELHRQKEISDAILRASSIGFAHGVDRKIVWYNHSMAKLFGTDMNEYINEDTRVLYQDDDEYNRVGAQIQRDLKQGVVSEIDSVFMKKDGTVFEGLMTVNFLDATEPERGVITSILDITERKRAEEAVRKSEQKFRQFAELLPQVVSEVDLEGNFLFVNNNGLKMFGYTREDLEEGITIFDVLQNEDRDKLKAHVFETLSTKKNSERDYMANRKDGATFPIKLYSSPILQDGRPVGLRSVLVDMSSEKEHEQQLRESEQKLRVIFDNSPLGLIHVSKDGKVINCNQAFAEILGTTKDNVIGFDAMTGLSNQDFFEAAYKTHTGHASYYEGEYESVISGIKTQIRFHGNPVSPGENPSEIIGVFEDITESINNKKELARIERELENRRKLESIGRLAGGIAHDFNNLLTPIMGHADIIKNQLSRGSLLHDDIDEILTASSQARDLVKQILVFSQDDKKTSEPVNISEIVSNVVNLLSPTLDQHINCSSILPGEPVYVAADRTRIFQVVMNLASNGIQAMKSTGGTIEISVEKLEVSEGDSVSSLLSGKGQYACIKVTDNGKGISSEDMDYIFEPFYTTRSDDEGTGLGLSVVHGIVTKYNGEISCSSEPGKGTVFSIYLPAMDSDQVAELRPHNDGIAVAGKDRRILVVDDREEVAGIVQKMLRFSGYNAEVESSGADALERINNNPGEFNLVITDLSMPRMSGLELAAAVKKGMPHIPVIIMTGNNEILSGDELESSGISLILYKPVMSHDLIKAVEEVLENT